MSASNDRKKRILFFNWAAFDDPEGRGGGVSVYLRNLIDVLSQRSDLEISFLSSGAAYAPLDRRVRCRETRNAYSDRGVRSFEIVNSPVRAPGRAMFHAITAWREDDAIRDSFRNFLTGFGSFDVFHIHNLEGISSAVLALRPEFPDTRFYFTWHNYIPLCPQVHLLYKEAEPCETYDEGKRCVGCVGPPESGGFMRNLGLPGTDGKSEGRGGEAAGYRMWRETNLHLMNEVIDGSIAVSQIAAETLTSLGVRAETIHTIPLGMDVFRQPDEMVAAWRAKPQRDSFTFSFLGFGYPAKGLSFLADALERADSAFLKQHVDFILAAKLNRAERKRYGKLAERFRSIRFIDGYDRRQLPELARQTDVNIVPSIWRETFCQVGYELLCLGTPSLLSSSVGLGAFYENKDDFQFMRGDHGDLVSKMEALAMHPEKVAGFWETPVHLPSMQTHADALLSVILKNNEPAL